MATPTEIQDDFARGQNFYSNLIHNEIFGKQIGLKNCNCGINTICMMHLLKAIEYGIEQERYDEILNKLHRDLILIIGKGEDLPYGKFYYNIINSRSLPTLSEILASPFISSELGLDPTIPLNNLNSSGPKYIWMAELLTETQKVFWQDIVIPTNNGGIGSITDLFINLGNVSTYRVYVTNYQTQFNNPIQFQTGG